MSSTPDRGRIAIEPAHVFTTRLEPGARRPDS
jgi:hypothetical protein